MADSANFSVKINSLNLRAGVRISPPQVGVTAIVGGNNVGKSTLLREIGRKLTDHGTFPGVLLDYLLLTTTGTLRDVETWLEEHVGTATLNGQFGYPVPNAQNVLPQVLVESAWMTTSQQPGNILGQLAPFVLYQGDAHSRIGVSSPAAKRPSIGDPATHPLHHLESTKEILDRVQAIFRSIFRESLTLDRLSGNLQLRVGETTVAVPSIEDISSEYVSELASLGQLHEQGDGMRSLMGIILPLITGQQKIVVIDEPEAFLHPPQARKLGAIIGQLASERSIQVLLATHDKNLLLGLLESGSEVAVVRLDRTKNGGTVSELPSEQVRKLWDNAVLRYSNVLDGLFHRAVVLAEGDRDCRFYEASLDHFALNSNPVGREDLASATDVRPDWSYSFTPGDILFVPANGKDGFTPLIEALRAVSVPVATVPDMDALNEESKVKALTAAVGIAWDSIRDDYRLSVAKLRSKESPRNCGDVLRLVQGVFEGKESQPFDRTNADLLRLALKRDNPWQEVKDHGAGAFHGAERKALERLDAVFVSHGIALVWSGQLESLGPTVVSKKGPGWLREAIDTESYAGSEAAEQAERICRAIENLMKKSES